MAVQLCPGNSALFRAETYSFTFEEVHLIYKLYTDKKFTLWKIKETSFNEAQIQEIAVAIIHAEMDIQKKPYDQRATFTYDPGFIELADFRVGKPSQ